MFEYDPGKSAANKVKHGIDFDEAQALWKDGRKATLLSRHRQNEDRWLVIGAIEGRVWTAIVTMRGEAVRIISVRRARTEEEKIYG